MVHYTRGITKRATRGGAHLRSDGDTVSDLTSPGMELQTSPRRVYSHYVSWSFIWACVILCKFEDLSISLPKLCPMSLTCFSGSEISRITRLYSVNATRNLPMLTTTGDRAAISFMTNRGSTLTWPQNLIIFQKQRRSSHGSSNWLISSTQITLTIWVISSCVMQCKILIIFVTINFCC